VRVTQCDSDIAVVEGLLRQLEVAGQAQHLGSDVVAEVMESKASDAGFRPVT